MKSRILIVDDDEIVRIGIAEGLEREGFETVRADSARQAMEIVAMETVDLVLTDLVMEGESGLSLLKQLRERLPDLPVMVITGHGTAASAIEALQQGATDYIQKPAKSEEIAHRIQAALDTAGLRRRLSQEQQVQRERRKEIDLRVVHAERSRSLRALAIGLDRLLATPSEILRKGIRLLADGIPSDSPLRRAVQAVDQAVEPLENLRNHLRRVSHPPAVKLELLDLQDVLQKHLASDAHTQLRGRHPHVRFSASIPLHPLPIQGNPEALVQSISCLLTTLFALLPRGGRVWMGAGREHDLQAAAIYREGAKGSYAHLVIGCTARLSFEQMDRFFEPFTFESSSAASSDTGFALAEILALIHAMQGFIRLQAVGEDGTEVHIHFPLMAQPEEASPSAVASIRGHERILVVDDHAGQRLEMGRLLESLGYQVHAVANGQEAILFVQDSLAGRGPIADAILMDLILGDSMDGAEACRQILEQAPNSRILLAGGFVETDRVVEARRLGVLDYLQKPLTRESLGNAIRNALEEGSGAGSQ